MAAPVDMLLLTRYLLTDSPTPDPLAAGLGVLVEELAGRRDLTGVDQVTRRTGVDVRRLQRVFTMTSAPKWVIIGCRLQDAAASAAADDAPDRFDLAADLGFADQAHLTGHSPGRSVSRPPPMLLRDVSPMTRGRRDGGRSGHRGASKAPER